MFNNLQEIHVCEASRGGKQTSGSQLEVYHIYVTLHRILATCDDTRTTRSHDTLSLLKTEIFVYFSSKTKDTVLPCCVSLYSSTCLTRKSFVTRLFVTHLLTCLWLTCFFFYSLFCYSFFSCPFVCCSCASSSLVRYSLVRYSLVCCCLVCGSLVCHPLFCHSLADLFMIVLFILGLFV